MRRIEPKTKLKRSSRHHNDHPLSVRGHTIDRTTMEDRLERTSKYLQQVWVDSGIDHGTLKTSCGAVIVAILAVYAGYLCILSLAEAPVTFTVPLPEQLREDWDGTKWDDVTGEEKKILENQVQGVGS